MGGASPWRGFIQSTSTYPVPVANHRCKYRLQVPAQLSAPLQMPVQTAYLTTFTYPVLVAASPVNQQVYLISAPATGDYQQPPPMRQVTVPTGQPYYDVQQMVQDVYREQPVYNVVPTSKVEACHFEGIPVMQPNGGVPQSGYVQVGYDGEGRHVYYMTVPYQGTSPMALAGGVPTLNQDGKVAVNAKAPPQNSSV